MRVPLLLLVLLPSACGGEPEFECSVAVVTGSPDELDAAGLSDEGVTIGEPEPCPREVPSCWTIAIEGRGMWSIESELVAWWDVGWEGGGWVGWTEMRGTSEAAAGVHDWIVAADLAARMAGYLHAENLAGELLLVVQPRECRRPL